MDMDAAVAIEQVRSNLYGASLEIHPESLALYKQHLSDTTKEELMRCYYDLMAISDRLRHMVTHP